MKKLILPIVFFILSSCYYDSEEALFGKPGACNTSVTNFSTEIKPIFSSYCLSCHSNSAAFSRGGGIKLQDYADVYAIRGRLIGTITHASGYSAMPKNSAMLSDCNISIITLWITKGALND
jgi:hypothetical protein